MKYIQLTILSFALASFGLFPAGANASDDSEVSVSPYLWILGGAVAGFYLTYDEEEHTGPKRENLRNAWLGGALVGMAGVAIYRHVNNDGTEDRVEVGHVSGTPVVTLKKSF